MPADDLSPVPRPEGAAGVRASDPERDAAIEALAGVPVRQTAIFGDVRRSGSWIVPARSGWRSGVGAAVVTIDAATVFGNIDLPVPEGIVVEIHGSTLFGDVRQETGGAAPAGAPRVVLVACTVFGDVRVRARRLRERLAERLRGPRGG